MSAKQRQVTLMSQLRDGASLATAVAAASTTLKDEALVLRKLTIVLDDLVIDIDESDDYGGTRIVTFPDTNVMILGCEVDLELVKGDTSNGLVAATDLDVAVGSAVASNSTLATTMIDVVDKVDLNATDLTPALEAHSNDNSSAGASFIADSATSGLFLNLAAAITASDTLTCTGTVTVYYVDLGNLSS